ncbi:MAG: PaaI family thioesterase [Candidatus Thalassarchaeaceae archaeon]|jgi:hypothetical protein|nr:PaaI family thioesterase [Euryarchaeota archaeon]NDB93235.1 PaaI family thioesterase [Euryarchaeota archaeon]NDF22083.1 PaaI family thioesterase [Euryarchaeota archaeon]NDF36313.1 PaaI family thioesterase [Euryarchaeota archaeon]NDG21172.1 PaaI family thioesterase [Euryarchaeota archaeon]
MEDQQGESVQEKYAKNSICFGCGPSNDEGLRIRSFRSGNGLKMEFNPSEKHQAFPGMINGGIIGTLLDCHGNWTAAIALMDRDGLQEPPCTVTASYSVTLKRPTPYGAKMSISAWAIDPDHWNDRVRVLMRLECEGKVCAEGEGLFVAVKQGHPAYHRWT